MQNRYSRPWNINRKIQLVSSAICCLLILVLMGCGGSSSSPAIKRSEGPGATKPGSTNGNGPDLSNSVINPKLFSSDHFAFVGFDVQKILQDPKTKDIEIDKFVEQMAMVRDQPLLNAKQIKRVYILMDTEMIEGVFDAMDSKQRESAPGIVIAFEQTQPIDVEAIEKLLDDDPTLSLYSKEGDKHKVWANLTSKVAVSLLDRHHLLVGAVKGVEKITKSESVSSLAIDASKSRFEQHVIGMMRFETIRPSLRSTLSLFKGAMKMVPQYKEELRMIVNLPEVTDTAQFQIDLSGDEILRVTAELENAKHAEELSKRFAQGLAAFSQVGGGPSMGSSQQAMISSDISAAFADLLKELEQGGAKIETDDKKVQVSVKQSKNTERFVRSIIDYSNRAGKLARRVETMTEIGKALKDYVRDKGAFPEASEKNKTGEPFNWRVAILPYLGHKELYEKFKFDEPWDSEHNLKIAKEIPAEYKMFSDGQKTTLRVASGIGAFEPKADGAALKIESVKDDLDETILVVEVSSEHAIEWTKPGALKVDKETMPKFGRDDENGFLVLMFEGQVRIVKKSSSKIDAMFTPAGDERIRKDNFLSLGF